MTAELLSQITVLVLAAVIGFELISRVPSLLHTPLMSATNAIHGVVLVGAMVVLIGPGGTVDHRARLHRGGAGDGERRRRASS